MEKKMRGSNSVWRMVLVGFKKRTKINFNEKMGEYLKKIYRGSENQARQMWK